MPGIDVLFVGPYDLGNNIGHSILHGTMHETLKEAIARIQVAAKVNKRCSGIYTTAGDQARQFADQGFQMVDAERSEKIQQWLICNRCLLRRTRLHYQLIWLQH